ncbi:MAG TPA: heme biosynthesis HemY N-terminal domain-containing protein [Burkholderiaceae bacterium]|nr:heme biosynthesis HemY N-terminal domain-containing protein [Burkholderiaceae bacterium]
MRAALWILALFGIAVAIALFAGNNQGTITVFWPPYRIDLSLNLVLLLLVAAFVFVHLALRALAALFSLPRQARRWRAQQKERAMHVALFDALSHLLAGRFLRAAKSADTALRQEKSLRSAREAPPHAAQLRTLSHLLLAESAQSLQDRTLRDTHLQQALEPQRLRDANQLVREGVQLRAARWALDDRDAAAALRWLDELPQGAQRRTLALRLRLKAARQARQTPQALETARLLAKHRAFSAGAAQSIVRGLALEMLGGAHDPAQLLRAWSQLDESERKMPEVAIQAAQRLLALQGDVELARQWLLPVWEQMVAQSNAWPDSQRIRLIRTLESGFDMLSTTSDNQWLTRIETAQQRNPRDANLQYLAGMVCLRHQLWGKAQQLLSQSVHGLQDNGLYRNAWRALAQLAEERDDAAAAANAWKQAAGT